MLGRVRRLKTHFPVFCLAFARTISIGPSVSFWERRVGGMEGHVLYGFTPCADFERRIRSSSCTFEVAAFVAESFWPAWSSRNYRGIWKG